MKTNQTNQTNQTNIYKPLAFLGVMFTLTIMLIVAVPVEANTWKTDIQKSQEQLSESYVETSRLCRIYIKKTKRYREKMRDDELAQATLINYERLLHKYCDPIAASQN